MSNARRYFGNFHSQPENYILVYEADNDSDTYIQFPLDWTRYVNYANARETPNVAFRQRAGLIFLVSTRIIREGDELLGPYMFHAP